VLVGKYPVEKNIASKADLSVSSPLHELVYRLPMANLAGAADTGRLLFQGGWNLHLLVLL
jgi:hypothetical protein